jgi:hypothetical protein
MFYTEITKNQKTRKEKFNMETKMKNFSFLTGNMLKILALLAMTCDHIGFQLFVQYDFLRWIGRLAFPIFAYMIAEGAKYTKNRLRYFLQMFGLGFLCQIVYFIAMGSLYQCILMTFSLSVLLIYALDYALKKRNPEAWLLLTMSFLAVFFLVEGLPFLLPNTDYGVDYGIWGVLTPVFVFLGQKKYQKLLLEAVPLAFLCFAGGLSCQWMALFALPVLALYNGKRGKLKMKNLFYIYYPLHLVVIYGLSLIL